MKIGVDWNSVASVGGTLRGEEKIHQQNVEIFGTKNAGQVYPEDSCPSLFEFCHAEFRRYTRNFSGAFSYFVSLELLFAALHSIENSN